MKIQTDHDLGKAEAKKRIKALLDYWKEKYEVKPAWKGDVGSVSGSIFGFSFDAAIQVEDECVVCEGPEPNLLVRKKVKQYIEHKLGEYLDPDTSIKDLAAKKKD